MITRGTTLEQLNAIGRKVGLTLYYDSSETIKLRAGLLHINDGTRNNVITISDEIDLSSYTFGSGSATYPTSGTNNQTWVYVTIDINGVLRLRLSTGTNATTNSERPDDSYYAWAGYEHTKGGYYYSSTERIIGVIYRNDSATSWYVINQGSEADEEGENSNGNWKALNDGVMEQWGQKTDNFAISNSSGYGGYYGSWDQLTFARAFITAPEATTTSVGTNTMSTMATAATTTLSVVGKNINLSILADRTYMYHAIGKWRA